MLRAGRVIVVIVACLSILNSMGTDGTWGHEDTNESVLSEIGRTIVPVLEPMGVSEENWPAAVGIFTGVLAKEAVVGTMNSLYDSMAAQRTPRTALPRKPLKTKPAGPSAPRSSRPSKASRTNLADLGGALLDPAGIHVDDLSDTAAAAEEQEVAVDTIRHDAAALREAGFRSLLLPAHGPAPTCPWRRRRRRPSGAKRARLGRSSCAAGQRRSATPPPRSSHRLGTFAENPTYSIVAIALSVAILAGMLLWMRTFAKKNGGKGRKVIPIYATR